MADRNAVVLLSGGLDSSTVLAIAQAKGSTFTRCPSSTGSGTASSSRRRASIAAEAGVARARGGGHRPPDVRRVRADERRRGAEGPLGRGDGRGIPVTYVPARNTVFLSFALAWAEVLEADDIFIGVNAVDYSRLSGLPARVHRRPTSRWRTSRPRGVEGQRLTIHTPLIDLTKAEIIQRGLDLGVDYALTLSCYDPSPAGEACGELRLVRAAPARLRRERRGRPGPVRSEARGRVTAARRPRAARPRGAKTFPVIEIFGPTIQGEGAEAGLPTHFVRFGGCDYRCSWCDTMYAVDPAVVRATAERLSGDAIVARARRRSAGRPSG